ncbi:flagellar export protein FliJ [Evansella cellulosilytica]|uniref:Flagellar FliJ protein n=1 Tax=Evansella cellulosilytica (strain ATCC 21833 / DSM 2522 / FERM P-1141 / JCM 9156 / N-4) TaxID=649639 RepID=E6TSW4_EVAC2|nr:flagellar export protein FliJ [Evansella cellulosilytica]ADU30756.1 flagellar export protein FliJ [Evansella cellulosilytica DSM 2522]
MPFQYGLQKVLEVKEHEKTEAELAYRDSMNHFENVATELYHQLKKKEDLLMAYDEKLKSGIPIGNIQHIQDTLQFLQKEINHLQRETQRTRDVMNAKQQKLSLKTVDVKKYEKMKERKFELYKLNEARLDNSFLDELSIQQFMKR